MMIKDAYTVHIYTALRTYLFEASVHELELLASELGALTEGIQALRLVPLGLQF